MSVRKVGSEIDSLIRFRFKSGWIRAVSRIFPVGREKFYDSKPANAKAPGF